MTDIYVTTSIPYVNAPPHVGFALELVQADAIARHHRLIGHEVAFQTGTDENAFKNVLAAREEGISTQELVDRNSRVFHALLKALNISASTFIRTTERRHRSGVQQFWRRLRGEDLTRRAYRGLYCTGCEDFCLPRDLVDGCCPEHGAPPVAVEETNWFFRLSAYQEQVERLLASGRVRVIPEKRRNEVLSFVRNGLADFSVSRDARRAGGWGIGVPGDGSQVIYVWIDALINYLSGQGFGTNDRWRRVWNDRTRSIHVIGKNVWKFHAVYWPALLLSASLPLPSEIVVHGFLTVNGRKIGKSLSNAVDPFACVEQFGADAVRYYLLKAVSPFDDGDFSAERLKQLYNTDLANGLGNLVSRLTTLCESAAFGRAPCAGCPDPPQGYAEALKRYEFDAAATALRAAITELNRQIEAAKPWELLKRPDRPGLVDHLRRWLRELYRVGYWLEPLLPDASARIIRALRQPVIRRSEPVFPRQ